MNYFSWNGKQDEGFPKLYKTESSYDLIMLLLDTECCSQIARVLWPMHTCNHTQVHIHTVILNKTSYMLANLATIFVTVLDYFLICNFVESQVFL